MAQPDNLNYLMTETRSAGEEHGAQGTQHSFLFFGVRVRESSTSTYHGHDCAEAIERKES